MDIGEMRKSEKPIVHDSYKGQKVNVAENLPEEADQSALNSANFKPEVGPNTVKDTARILIVEYNERNEKDVREIRQIAGELKLDLLQFVEKMPDFVYSYFVKRQSFKNLLKKKKGQTEEEKRKEIFANLIAEIQTNGLDPSKEDFSWVRKYEPLFAEIYSLKPNDSTDLAVLSTRITQLQDQTTQTTDEMEELEELKNQQQQLEILLINDNLKSKINSEFHKIKQIVKIMALRNQGFVYKRIEAELKISLGEYQGREIQRGRRIFKQDKLIGETALTLPEAFNISMEGLLEAIFSWDPDWQGTNKNKELVKDVQFSTWATYYIKKHLLKEIKEHQYLIYIPPFRQSEIKLYSAIQSHLKHKLDSNPNYLQIVEFILKGVLKEEGMLEIGGKKVKITKTILDSFSTWAKEFGEEYLEFTRLIENLTKKLGEDNKPYEVEAIEKNIKAVKDGIKEILEEQVKKAEFILLTSYQFKNIISTDEYWAQNTNIFDLDGNLVTSYDYRGERVIPAVTYQDSSHPDNNLLRKDVEALLNILSDREREIIKLRYGLEDGKEMTFQAIGDIFNVSKHRIRQIEARALRKLRTTPENAIVKGYS